jgi:S-adenosylmethionine:tRNA ribosyltransferase-isomerase
MQLEDFDYALDDSLIAQQPIEPRDNARMMVVDSRAGMISHEWVYALPKLLKAGDLLILNDTRVFPARLFGTKKPSGGKVELLLIRPQAASLSPPAAQGTVPPSFSDGDRELWQVLIKGKVHSGQELEMPQGVIAVVLACEEGTGVVSFPAETDVFAYAEKAGAIPLPPYIRRMATETDRERYQTIFARSPGAVAAPTAGLHFTEELLSQLHATGVRTATVTLHVGPGTFKPVTSSNISDHLMDPERYELPDATVQAIRDTQKAGGRIVAVGSTAVRVLETAAAKGLPLAAGSGETSLFIYPGYTFKIVSAMLTNFHLPKSTLFMLVCALGGRELMLKAYRLAVSERYRFYSYGDAMLIV